MINASAGLHIGVLYCFCAIFSTKALSVECKRARLHVRKCVSGTCICVFVFACANGVCVCFCPHAYKRIG